MIVLRMFCLNIALFLNLQACATFGGMEVRGVSLAHLHREELGYGSAPCREQLSRIASVGGNWVAVMDFAYMARVDEPNVVTDADPTLREEHLKAVIRDAHDAGLKVLVKPHIWSDQFWHNFRWHGDIRMTSEADWDAWFAAYGKYIIDQAARLAAETGADAFCIGNELQGTADQETRWRELIARVREVYRGPITYASAFGEWPNAKWYDALDCVGINAYFPLTGRENADDEELRRGWKAVFDKIEPYQRKWNKPVCFTEIGYTRSAEAGMKPWAYDFSVGDADYQARLYRVAIEETERQPYMVGMFLWKWFTADTYERAGEKDPFPLQDRADVLEAITSRWNRR